jgi:hypothetical protein
MYMSKNGTASSGAPKAAKKPKAAKSKTPKASQRPRKAKMSRETAQGDIAPTLTPAGIEAHVIDEAVQAATISKAIAVKDILLKGEEDPDGSARALRAILEGASPDDAVALRRMLIAPAAPIVHSRALGPDEELAEGWREGAYPYKNLLSRKSYEKQKYQPAGGVAEAAGLGQGKPASAWSSSLRAAMPLARAERDQTLHGTSQPARRARDRAGEAHRDRSAASGISSGTCATAADRRRDS